ncbi:MAG: hypothetical protein GXP41_08930 [Chloroflexi bacterium]|nr:hypothetical protein [Chloroflexota bacterium]
MALLIDGHNLIAKMPGMSLADPEDEQQLIQILRRYVWRKRKKISVVFDPGLSPGYSTPATSSRNIRVTYAPPNHTADSVIIQQVKRHRNPREVIVVTSDREIIRTVQKYGAQTISSRAFASELRAVTQPVPDDNEKPMAETGAVSPDEVAYWLHVFQGDK